MWVAIDLAILAALMVLGLVSVYRRRRSMDRREVVKWTLALVLVPIIGVVAYFFSRLDAAVQRGTSGRRDETAPFLRSFRDHDR